MNVTFYRKPCLLLETVELVYAHVNQISEKKLTASGEFCIPAEEVRQLQAAVCAELSCPEEELQFYFHGISLSGETNRIPCIARCLVYNSLEVDSQNTEDMLSALSRYWASLSKPVRVSNMDFYSVNFDRAEPGAFTPLSREMKRLPVPPEYHAELVDVFSNYDMYLTRLGEILAPAIQKLEALLEPWVQRAQPLMDQWEAFLSGDNMEDFFRNRAQIYRREFGPASVAMRYFPAELGYLRICEPSGEVKLLVGVGMKPGTGEAPRKESLADWEYAALRLLSNPDRIAMLNAMMDEPMSGPALMQKLGLHSGSVFRDLNSMNNAHLLVKEYEEGKNVYRTNFAVVRDLSRRMLQAIDPRYEE